MKIDVRNESADHINEIQFAEDEEFVASRLIRERDSAYQVTGVKLVDVDGDEEGSVELKDIGNLILALKKAKELWG